MDGPASSALFGSAVSSAGDVNADGYDDIVVGAPGYSNGQTGEGAAYVYYGSASGVSRTVTSLEGNSANASFGTALAFADVDLDGFSDLAVGAPNYSNSQSREGGAFLYLGSATGLSTTAAWASESDQALASFGNAIASGDMNGDGYADIVVGAYQYNATAINTGRMYLYLGP